MIPKFTAWLAAAALALTALAPVADAREHRGDRHYRGGYGYDHHYRDRHDHDNDAVAAGVVGLVLGLALGAAASNSDRDRDGCYDRCAPPPRPRCDQRCGGYYEQGYDPRYDQQQQGYDDRESAYDRDYGGGGGSYQQPQCTRRERQWDRYAQRYVMVDVPC